MEYFVAQGESKMDCQLKIAEKYKRPFKILTQKEIKLKSGFLGLFSKPGVEVEWYFTPKEDDLETRKRKLIEAAAGAAVSGKSFEQAAALGKASSDEILNTLYQIKEKIENGTGKEEHASFVKIAQILKSNDFSESYINGITERMRRELSLEKLDDFDIVQDHVVEWIGESISIYKEEEITRKPRIFVLIGPTGVGKTTTIAKLAAFYGIKREDFSAYDVRLITIDALRICAFEQLEKIGTYMNIPVSLINAETPEQTQTALRREIAIHKDIDLFFIDTFGNNPKDASRIGEMKTILNGAGRTAEYHLAVSAATKTSDLENIFRQFEPFNYKSIVLTKMDETENIGNIISILAEKRKPVSYITDGQGLPKDIKKASVVRFLINLDGFKIDREKIERRFPPGDADQFKWR